MNILRLQFISIEEAKKAVNGTCFSYLNLCNCQGVKKLKHKLVHDKKFKDFTEEETRATLRNFYKNELIQQGW